MPVTTKHKQYDKAVKRWTRCRDTSSGSDVVKERGIEYLPSLPKQTPTEYAAYKMRATFYNATGRTIQGLMGAIFRRNATYEYPSNLEEHLENVTPQGLELEEFARSVVKEVITVGRIGALVDIQQAGDLRAYAITYTAENIINWESTKINGQMRLSLVVLREVYDEPNPEDSFERAQKIQYRVLRLAMSKNNQVYTQELWRRKEGRTASENWYIWRQITPRKGGVALDFIPFQFINVSDLTDTVDKPPLLDLVEVNLSHYRTSADLEHGAHFTALPTPWIAGFNPKNEFSIGSGRAWVTENTEAKAGMLEYTGQGLGALREIKQDKENLMAVLGARMLEQPKKAVEAADTLRIRASGESGALSVIAGTASDGIEKILKWLAWWSGATDAQVSKISYDLNEDFVDVEISPQLMQQLLAALQANKISLDTFLYNLKVGEVLPPDRTIEEEKDLLDAEPADQDYPEDVTPLRKRLNIVRDDDGKPVAVEEEG